VDLDPQVLDRIALFTKFDKLTGVSKGGWVTRLRGLKSLGKRRLNRGSGNQGSGNGAELF
jgi:hypothetical protein